MCCFVPDPFFVLFFCAPAHFVTKKTRNQAATAFWAAVQTLVHTCYVFGFCTARCLPLATNIYPDFITVDGGEGGTGAAPSEFVDGVGMPMTGAVRRPLNLPTTVEFFVFLQPSTQLGAKLLFNDRGALLKLAFFGPLAPSTPGGIPLTTTNQNPVRSSGKCHPSFLPMSRIFKGGFKVFSRRLKK